MAASKVEQAGKRRFLICYYNNEVRDWDQCIAKALSDAGLDPEKTTVICRPLKKGYEDGTTTI